MEKVLKNFHQSSPQLTDTASSVRNNIQCIEEYNVCFEQLQHLVDIAADNIINNIKQKEEKGE